MSTTATATIESRKQENALRLQLIKRMKDDFSHIAPTVLSEVYGFDNALDWLKESLEQMGGDTTAAQEAELKQLLKDGIDAGCETMRTARATLDQDMAEIKESTTAVQAVLDENQKRLQKRYKALKAIGDILELHHANSDPEMLPTWRTLIAGHIESLQLWVQDCNDASKQREQAIEVARDRREKCATSFEVTEQGVVSVIRMLQRIARALDMEEVL